MNKLILSLSCGLLCCVQNIMAQGESEEKGDVVYKLTHVPVCLDNYQSGFYYSDGGKVFTMRNFPSAIASHVLSLKVSPAGVSYSFINEEGGKRSVNVYNLWKPKELIASISTDSFVPTSLCYSADSRSLYVSSMDGTLYGFETSGFKQTLAMSATVAADRLVASPNGYFVAAGGGNEVEVLNVEGRSVRTKLAFGGVVKDVEFSANSQYMAVLTDDGNCNIYDTATFNVLYSYNSLGTAESCFFHPDNKYIAVVTGDQRVAIINMLNEKDRRYVDSEEAGVKLVKFVEDVDKGVYMAYNTGSSIVFNPVFYLSPNRMKQLTDELNSRMDEWMKRMDGESLEDYNARVNEQTRAEYAKMLEMEIATRMADNLMSMSEVSLGNYNPEMGMLTLDFNNMPSIYLSVPQDQLGDFMDPGDLQFNNNKYIINANDEYELVYSEVTNTKTGQTYVFDNQERKSLDFLTSDDNFIPFAQAQASAMEEMGLENIMENVMTNAKQQAELTDHTKIDVKTRVEKDTDADGNPISNYRVSVSYTVDKEFSAKEDFASAVYKTEQSKAALAMLEVVKQALEGDLAKYVVPGKKVNIMITGMADAVPFSRTVAYDGSYGDFVNEPVYDGKGGMSNVTILKAEGMNQNEQLAFLRATGVKRYLQKNVPSLSSMDCKYETTVNVSDKAGSEYRRIGVEFVFVDAFNN
ncbi:MAG: hypothetical protein SOZ58_07435 [Prevotella sp.]|nr:hypothetical protein [Prevotella sp.]